jgi:hypothetical protein
MSEVTLTLRCSFRTARAPLVPFKSRLGGSQIRSGRFGEQNILELVGNRNCVCLLSSSSGLLSKCIEVFIQQGFGEAIRV